MNPTVADIAFDPLVPWWAIYALGGAALLLMVLALRARARGAWLRLLVIIALLAALANPILVEEERRSLPDIALVMVDQSESQSIGERPQQLAAARAELARRFGRLDRLEVREVVLPPASAAPIADTRGGTRLIEAMNTALADIPRDRLAGVLLLTDGQVHDAPEAGNLPAIGAPVHVLLTGRRGELDRRLVIEQAPRFGVVGKTVSMKLKVEDEGAPPGTTAGVDITVQGQPLAQLRLPIGRSETVELPIRQGSDNVVEVTAEAGPRELTLENNRALLTVNGVRDRLRVLLVSGEPYQGERAWRNLLKSDPAVDLVHFTILRTPAKDDFTPVRELSLIVFPMNELFDQKLSEFNLIIFDRYEQGNIITPDYFRNIARYVQNGGALLLSVGPVYASQRSLFRTPLGPVLPAQPTGRVVEGGFKPRLTDTGHRHPVTASLPGGGINGADPSWGRWFRLVTTSVGNGETLMRGSEDQPLLVVNRIGEGRVAQLLSDHLWLWNRGIDGGGPQAELVRRLAHWLMKEPDLEEESMRAVVHGNRIEVTRQTLAESFAPIRMTGPDGAVRELTPNQIAPGRGLAVATVDKPGVYRFEDGSQTTVAAVGSANPLEFADVRATEARLSPLAEATGGALLWLADTPDPELRQVREGRTAAGRDWLGLVRKEAYSVAGVREYPLLPGIALAFLLLLGLGFAWYREGRP